MEMKQDKCSTVVLREAGGLCLTFSLFSSSKAGANIAAAGVYLSLRFPLLASTGRLGGAG